MKIEIMDINALEAAVYNPRKDLHPGDPEYERLKKSIVEFDYIDPIIWNKRNKRIVGGHQRIKILKELGYKEIEVSVVDLPEDKEKALNIALNKTGGDWDYMRLKDLLVDIDTGAFDIEITGFGEDEIAKLINKLHDPESIEEDDFDPEAEAEKINEPETKSGDIWNLGDHRLMCGDATSIIDVEKLMGGKLADMIWTDPPYNVDYVGKTQDELKIKNDRMADNQFYKFLYDAFISMFIIAKPGAAIYVAHADTEGINFRISLTDAGWMHKQTIIWVKNTFVMGRQDYHWQHEPILYGWKPGKAHNWFAMRDKSTVIDDDIDLKKMSKAQLFDLINQFRTQNLSTILRDNKPNRSAIHPTMKPIRLVAQMIMNSSKGGDLIVDLFGGSGTTLMAAEKIERKAYLMELDPVYCDVIKNRYIQSTGKRAIKEEGE